ncbi:AAA family ATPase [Candidatus Methylospira mobilis]|uniref:AAA family ATPase n=1 Tax=Candidatus Methylospira mobilis TaxID=1808979 RepID=A0A5Q0BKZ6_9GAMM|nr:AAA family ATPase [Candidatus Methylospira mobilis]QFY44605.1 AAA family ATPase [Candidatus Methylospira mobilis]
MIVSNSHFHRRIKSISIEGFRSLAKIEQLELPQLTVLIGSNGAGKSNFIRFFEMLSWMLRGQKLQEFILRQGGADDQLFMGARQTPRINAELRIETEKGYNDYRFGLAHLTAGDSLMFVDEAYRYSDRTKSGYANWSILDGGTKESGIVMAAQSPKNNTARVIVSLLRQSTTYQFHDTSAHAYIKQAWDVTDNAWLRSDGANLAPVLLRLQETDLVRYKLIVRQIQRVLPTFNDFLLQPSVGKVELRWQGKYSDKSFGAHLTSDGSLRLFCLLTLLNLPSDMLPDILFFDEPELGLHPHAISLIAEMLKKIAHTRQVFIATQSPYMVDCFSLENIIIADLKDGATSLRNLPKEQYQQWLDDDYRVSDLWLKNVVGSVE